MPKPKEAKETQSAAASSAEAIAARDIEALYRSDRNKLPSGARALLDKAISIPGSPYAAEANIDSSIEAEVILPDDLADIQQLANESNSYEQNRIGHPRARFPLAGGHLRNPKQAVSSTRSQLSFQPNTEATKMYASGPNGRSDQSRARMKNGTTLPKGKGINFGEKVQQAKNQASKAIQKADDLISDGISSLRQTLGIDKEEPKAVAPENKTPEQKTEEKAAELGALLDDLSAPANEEAPAVAKLAPTKPEVATEQPIAEQKEETAKEEPAEIEPAVTKAEEKSDDAKTEAIIDQLTKDETAVEEAEVESDGEEEVVEVSKTETTGDDRSVAAKRSLLSKISFGSYSLLHEGIIVLAILAGFFIVTWMRLEFEFSSKKDKS